MELLFLWIGQEYRKIFKDQLIVFSDKFNIEYFNNSLIIKSNASFIDVYEQFESIVGVSAIVGDNGAGKTSLLRYIINAITSDDLGHEFELEKSLIAFYYPEEKLIKIFSHNKNVTLENYTELTIEKHKYKGSLFKLLKNFNVLFLTNSIDSECKDSQNNFININARSLIETSNLYFHDKLNFIKANILQKKCSEQIFRKNHILKLEDFLYIKYFSDIKTKNLKFCGKTYNDVEIVVNPFYYSIDLDDFSQLSQYETFFKQKSFNEVYFIDILIKNLLFDILSNLNQGSRFIYLITELIYYCNYFEKFVEKLKNIVNAFNDKDGVTNRYRKYILESIQFVVDFNRYYKENKIEIETIETYSNSIEQVIHIDVNLLYKLLKSKNNEMKLFPAKYLKILNFNFSSGEKALLNFFAWINSISILNKDKSFKISDNYLFIIDEIDLYAHPQWQKQLLSLLLEQLNREYKNKHIQLIFTTHSPILLTDVPKSNTVFIKKIENEVSVICKDKRQETFSANIYDLYHDAFFLDNSYVGNFAQNFINNIFKEISCRTIDADKSLFNQINLIGEPILKFKLIELYKGKFEKND